MSILDVVQSQSHSILSINYRLQIIELINTTEFELKHGFGIGFRQRFQLPEVLNQNQTLC